MGAPKFSVVIPTYNGKEYLGEAVQSVLDQTYPDFEIIIVDDASPEEPSQVLASFTDARVQYIRHVKNKGAVAARKTGVDASRGEIIAFLDQDDLFHEQKLETHLRYFLEKPETGLTYNDRFEIQGIQKVVWGIYRPPADLRLADLVLGYPISPSDVVLKREWAFRNEIWDDSFSSRAEHVIFNGQEIVFGGRLALAGCKFGYVGRALNYRRFHPYRILKHLTERCQAELDCQQIIFSDPRCPEEVRALGNLASSKIYIMYAFAAYVQEEFELGRRFLKQSMELDPGFFIDGDSCEFLNTWLMWISAGTVAYMRSHEEILQSVFENLPAELASLLKKHDEAIAQSYLLKGFRTLVWGTREDAEDYILTAFEKGARVDDAAMSMLTDDLLNQAAELGSDASQQILGRLSDLLSKSNRRYEAKGLVGFYMLNRAFRNYYTGRFESVPGDVAEAVRRDHKYLLNRGVISILFRSLYHRPKLQGFVHQWI